MTKQSLIEKQILLRLPRSLQSLAMTVLLFNISVVYAQTSQNFNAQGLSYLKQNNPTAAITALTKAITADHNDAEGYANRALADAQLGRLADAISDATQAIEINPQYANAYYIRGAVYYEQGHGNPAIDDFTQAIAINPKVAKGYFTRALTYLRMNEPQEAVADLTQVLAINPKEPRAFYNRAVAYYQLKQYDKAWADVHAAQGLGFKVNPDFLVSLRAQRGNLLKNN